MEVFNLVIHHDKMIYFVVYVLCPSEHERQISGKISWKVLLGALLVVIAKRFHL